MTDRDIIITILIFQFVLVFLIAMLGFMVIDLSKGEE